MLRLIKEKFLLKFHIHFFAFTFFIILLTGIVLCYITGINTIHIEPGNWNMDAISLVY